MFLRRHTIIVASLLAVLCGSCLAHARHIRSVVDRRQHANGAFFEKSKSHVASPPHYSPIREDLLEVKLLQAVKSEFACCGLREAQLVATVIQSFAKIALSSVRAN